MKDTSLEGFCLACAVIGDALAQVGLIARGVEFSLDVRDASLGHARAAFSLDDSGTVHVFVEVTQK